MKSEKSIPCSLDARRRRIVFRAWKRGLLEMDLMFGQYVDAHIAVLDDRQLDELEHTMSFEDRDLLSWITGEIKMPANIKTSIFRDILAYREKMDFV
ncbi:MAG: hypothetical protein JSC085_000018 [Candidatus Tokpelaia sp. JSC085]|nr:MAG: hypothetical protein JSC085_000018 [Candidatus Tokpelaia sp. JSC085]